MGIISPFNFPLEIPVLQFMGALFMGNKPVVKSATKCAFAVEQWVRMMHYCGLPKEDMDFLHVSGSNMETLLKKGNAKLTQFTGSSETGE